MRTKQPKNNKVKLLNSNQMAKITNSLVNTNEEDDELSSLESEDDDLDDFGNFDDDDEEDDEETKEKIAASKKEQKVIENDQQPIIDAISIGDYDYVWDIVKHIGIDKVKNINQRMSKFYSIVKQFDYTKNNNFIHFYRTRLGWYDDFFNNSTFIVTRTRQVMKELIIQGISPDDVSNTLTVKHLINWQ